MAGAGANDQPMIEDKPGTEQWQGKLIGAYGAGGSVGGGGLICRSRDRVAWMYHHDMINHHDTLIASCQQYYI